MISSGIGLGGLITAPPVLEPAGGVAMWIPVTGLVVYLTTGA